MDDNKPTRSPYFLNFTRRKILGFYNICTWKQRTLRNLWFFKNNVDPKQWDLHHLPPRSCRYFPLADGGKFS